MSKKAIKIGIGVLTVVLCFTAVVYTVTGYSWGFQHKSTGSQYFVFDKDKAVIEELCGEELSYNELIALRHNKKIDNENDKILTTEFTNENGEIIKIQCEMNWYWSNTYQWSIID